MKNKNANVFPIRKERVLIPYSGRDLQQEWSEAVSRTGEIYFEVHRREEHHLKNKQPIAFKRFDVFMVFLITGREGFHKIGSEEYYLQPGILCFVPADRFIPCRSKIHEHTGYFCAFTPAFFGQNLVNKDSLFQHSLFNTEESVALQLDDLQTAYFYNLFHQIEEEYHSENANKEDLIRALLNVLLQKAQQLIGSSRTDCVMSNSNAGVRLTKAFAILFEKDLEPLKTLHIVETKSLADYASALHVTQNYFNDTIKGVTGQTPGEIIRERLVKEASQLLISTQLSIAEICFLLKFEDTSYFSRFFKRYTGLTPSQCRKKGDIISLSIFPRFCNPISPE